MGSKCCIYKSRRATNKGDCTQLDLTTFTDPRTGLCEDELSTNENAFINEVTSFHSKLPKFREKHRKGLSLNAYSHGPLCFTTESNKPSQKLDESDRIGHELVVDQNEEKNENVTTDYRKYLVKPFKSSGFRAESEWNIPSTQKFQLSMAPEYFRRENKSVVNTKYDSLETVGKGAFGEVKRVRDKATGCIRAMKVIAKEKCEASSKFADEIKILQKLDHPNVLRFYEFYQDVQNYYLITEYCKGGDLLNKLSMLFHFPEIQAAKIMRQILAAVEYCHRLNVVHRDLKPENIVFEGEGSNATVKIIDFGRSRILKYRQEMNELAGSILYMAPEVLAGKAYNEKSDIWSCGVLMYLLIIGFPPFSGKTKDDILQNIMKGRIDFSHPNWRRVSESAKGLIRQLLEINPKVRVTAAAALSHPWIQKSIKPTKVRVSGLRRTIENLKNFGARMIFQQAVLSYIASQQIRKEDEGEIREMYKFLDIDQDGRVSKKDIVQGFIKLYADPVKAKREADKVVKSMGFDKMMCIGYNEFLAANLQSPEKRITKETLRAAFGFYDEDGKGYIGITDLQRVLGEKYGDDIIKKIVEETDSDNDQKITFQDFKRMMEGYLLERKMVIPYQTQAQIIYLDEL